MTLEQLRKSRRMTYREFAAALGTPLRTTWRWCTSGMADTDEAVRVSRLTGVPVLALLYPDGVPRGAVGCDCVEHAAAVPAPRRAAGSRR